MSTETTEKPATLADLLDLVSKLREVAPMGRDGRKILLRLADLADDVDTMTGLVVKGEVHRVTLEDQHAPCGCRSKTHPFTRDGWFGRAHWTTKSEAQQKRAKLQGHIVRRTVAYTDMEVVQ